MHQGQELTHIVGPLFQGPDVENLLSGGHINPPILHVSRITTASRIHRQTLRNRFPDRRFRGPIGNRFGRRSPFQIGRIALFQSLPGLLIRLKGFEFSSLETMHLGLTILPIVIDTGIHPFPYYIIFTFRHLLAALSVYHQSNQGSGFNLVRSFHNWKCSTVELPSSVSVKILPIACLVVTLSPAFTYT